MRRPLKQYAQALYAAVHTQDTPLSSVLQGFVQLLAADGVLSKVEQILVFFRKEWNARERSVDLTITTAHEISAAQQKRISDAVIAILKKEKASVQAIVDPAIIGGMRIQYDGTIFDGSVQRQLMTLKEKMVA